MEFRERKQENDHFGSTKQVCVDPSGGEILTLGEDDHLLNCFICESITLSSAHDLKILDGKNVNSFYFLPQSETLLVAAENQIYSFNWPKCDIQRLLYNHDHEINLLTATSSENIIAISDVNNDVFLIKHTNKNECSLIQKVFSSNSKIVWMEFGSLCDTLAIYSSDLIISIIDSKSFDLIYSDKTSSYCIPSFTNHSDLLFLKDGYIISRSQIHQNYAAFKNKNHNSEINIIVSSKSSNHIATYDSNGTIVVSQYDRSLFTYFDEPNLDSPHELPFVLTINRPSPKITSLFWRYDTIAAGDEEGGLYFWQGVAGIQKPNAEANKKKQTKKKALSFIDSLTAPVDPSRARKPKDDDEDLEDIDDDMKSKKKTKEIKKPKKTQKKAKQQKINAKNYLIGEKISDDDDESEMEGFIENKEEFEERIKHDAPEPEPEIDIPISESSSDHEIDIEPYLTPEQREKLHPHKEEEEQLEKADDFADSTDLDEENMDNIEDDLEGFEFDHIFMPGNNDHFVGNRRYLCWNYFAAVLLRRNKDDLTNTEIDIHFFEEGRTKSIPNTFNYSIASIDENGIILASHTNLYYEHHKSWAPDKTTSLQFEDEKISLVACGKEWFAVATDAPCIRLFTSAGLELGIVPLPLSCQVMVGRGKYLFYAYPNGNNLEYAVMSVLNNKVLITNKTVAAIRPIKWAGFDNANKIYIQDRNNFVYLLSKDFSWQWIPVIDLKDYYDTTTTNIWVVKVEDDMVFGTPLRSQRSPATYPIPKLHSFDTHIMTFDTEVRPWLSKMMLPNTSKIKTDAELLKMFPSAIQSDHEFRAFHIAEQMRSDKARKFAVTYADKLNATIVADKLTGTDSKPQKKVFTIARENSEESKSMTPSRSFSSSQEIYVRKANDSEAPKPFQNNQEPEQNDNDDDFDDIKEHQSDDSSDEENKEQQAPPTAVNSLFEALKKLGSKPTSIISSKNDIGYDAPVKKKSKPKRTTAPIVHRKRPRKAKNDDTASFQPLFK